MPVVDLNLKNLFKLNLVANHLRWLLYFDGNMWLETPELTLEAGDVVRFQWFGEMPPWRTWISIAERGYELRYNESSNSVESFSAIKTYLNGVEIVNGETTAPTGERVNTFEIEITQAVTSRIVLGARDSYPVEYQGKGYFLNLEVVDKHKYPINEGAGSIVHNLLEPAFPELIPDGNFDAPGNWVVQDGWVIENGKAICNTSSGSKNIGYDIPFDSGKTYLVKINVSEATAGSLRLLAYAEGNQTSIHNVKNVGNSELLIRFGASTGSANQWMILQAYNGWVGKIESISVKETTHAQIINGQPSSWERKRV